MKIFANRMSRREMLKLSGVIAIGTLIDKVLKIPDISTVYSRASLKRIYLAPDDHTDYMWIADEATYRQAFIDMLDYYLDLADATQNNPPEYQSRWNCDGSFWIWVYEKNKPAADYQRLVDRIRDGHVSMPLNTLVVCLGGAPAEAVLRGMYYAGRIERRENLRFRLAYTVENQTMPYGLGALWAGSGAKYCWKGICGCASHVPDAWDRPQDIYWWSGPDGSKILMKWNSMLTNNQGMGGYAEARDPGGVVEYVDSNSGFIGRYPYSVIGAFGKGWDGLKTLTNEFVTVAQSKSNSTRKVIVSNEEDFFLDFEATYGNVLPTISASYGNEWDLYCTSMAEVSARVKRAVEKLRNAEALATLVSMVNPSFMNNRVEQRNQAWLDLGLYWEHDWTADGPVSRNSRRDWQRRLASEIESYVNPLQSDTVAALGGMIQKTVSTPCFFAFNALGWSRTDIADLPYPNTGPVQIIDMSTGLETPSQIVSLDGQRYLRVLAQNVPAVGYKCFEIRPGQGQSFTNAATTTGGQIQNEYYKVTVAERGAITSLVDKTRGNREFVRVINGRAMNDLGPSSGSLQVENAGPVTVTLIANALNPINHTTRITFIRNSQRIEIRNDINQNFTDLFTWGFGFELSNPDVWHEEVGAIILAKLLDQGGHYSPRNARYDWLTLNHFADISGSGVGVTLSNNDCYFMRLGSSQSNFLDTSTPQLSVLVGGQVDGPFIGIPNQGGDSHFLQRFALQTHDAYDKVAAMKFALEHQNPLVTGLVSGGSAYPGKSYSFLSISNPNVLMWALKPHEDGISNGLIVRLWNLSSDQASFSLTTLGRPIQSAQYATHIETLLGPAEITGGALTSTLAAQQLKTFLIRLSDSTLLNRRVYLPHTRR